MFASVQRPLPFLRDHKNPKSGQCYHDMGLYCFYEEAFSLGCGSHTDVRAPCPSGLETGAIIFQQLLTTVTLSKSLLPTNHEVVIEVTIGLRTRKLLKQSGRFESITQEWIYPVVLECR